MNTDSSAPPGAPALAGDVDPAMLVGFGNHFATEAVAGALPIGRNSPQHAPFGLYAEQVSGTAFTAPRTENRRSWLYRLRPTANHPAYQPHDRPGLLRSGPFNEAPATPNRLRWNPFPIPSDPVDFVDGLTTLCGNGDPAAGVGLAAHVYMANRSMTDRAFYNADGEMLIVPEQGNLRLVTEMGVITVDPQQIAVVPRGLRLRVELPAGPARGYVCENYGAPFRLPDLGPIGSNGLANPRDFEAPRARFEDVDAPHQIVQKFQGKLWTTTLNHSPFDVVAWHGNLTPYRYDLRRFNTINTVSFDHPDPSIFTVLTSPSDTPGTANCDFVIFPPRWMVAEQTFRPPWFHRNVMSEFMGLVHGAYDAKAGGFAPGGASLHNQMSGHGPDRASYELAVAAELQPHKIEGTMAFMFESRHVFRPTAFALQTPCCQLDYDDCWADFRKAAIPAADHAPGALTMAFPVIDETHDPDLRSWVESAAGDEIYPVQNLPFGVFTLGDGKRHIGVAIGNAVLDLAPLAARLPECARAALDGATLNALLALPATERAALRRAISRLLCDPDAQAAVHPHLWLATEVEMQLPATIGDYTDFYVGIHHATNVGRVFRPDNPLLPNYKYVPIGYHGRASSIRVSGVPVRRPAGQRKPPDAEAPVFGPSARLDYELELGIWIGPGNALGEPIPIAEAGDHIAGFCLLNDWSARDLQAWEYVPLGPFLAKNFHTTISPWVVTAEALAPFRPPQPERPKDDPRPLPYLWDADDQARGALALDLAVSLSSERMRAAGMPPQRLSTGPASNMYWTAQQIVAHHTSNGCDLNPGDLLGTGTISAPDLDGCGSLLELSSNGTAPVTLPTGERRTFLEDGDEVRIGATARASGYVPIGFGDCRAIILPAL